MDDNHFEPNSWEFSLEAILAEYASEPERAQPRTPEETRSREIVMEALSERIAASVSGSTDFSDELAYAPAAEKSPSERTRGARLRPREREERRSRVKPQKSAVSEPDAPYEAEAPAADEASALSASERNAVSAAPDASPVIPFPVRPAAADAPVVSIPVRPAAETADAGEKQAEIFDIADILAEVRAAQAAEAQAAQAAPAEQAQAAFAETEIPAEAAHAEPEAAEAAPETQAVGFTDSAGDAYASETLPPMEDEPEDEAPDRRTAEKPGRPSAVVALLAALLIRRRQRAAKAAAQQAAEPEEELPEANIKTAAKYYIKSVTPYRLRFLLSALLCVVLLYISAGLPVAGALKNVRVGAGMCMLLELGVMLIGLDVFTGGMTALFAGKPTLSSLISVSCICSVLDAAIILAGGPQHGLPFCAVSAVTLCLALLGERQFCLGMARTLHTAAASVKPTAVSAEEGILSSGSALIRSDSGVRGFVNRSQEADAVETAYSSLAPILLAAAPVLAVLATVCRRQAGDFFHCLSALTAVGASFSAVLSFSLPFSVAAKRLASAGAAVAGWAGCADIGESRRTVVTDGDVFPAGNVLIDTIRILEGMYTDKVISYAGSVIAFSGCGLVPAFTDLMHRNGCAIHQVENFACHKGGGLTAIVRGEQVYVGNSSFMNLMGIRLPQSQMSKTSVFVAISGELVGVFSIRYVPTASVQEALVSLLRSRSGEPLFAIRDFNVTPLLIKQRFRMPTEGFEFPSFPERYRISAAVPDEKSRPAALLVRKGLAPYVEASQTGRALYRGSRFCLLLSLLGSVLGTLLLFFLCALGAYDSASVGNILLFMFLWLVPVILVALGLRR